MDYNHPLIPALVWLVAAGIWFCSAPWLQSRIQRSRSPGAQRFAEFPYLLRRPVTALLLLTAGLMLVSPLFAMLRALVPIASGFFDYGEQTFVIVLRLSIGLAVGFCLYRALELVRTEFIERSLSRSSRGQHRNTALVGYYLLLPVVFLAIAAVEGTMFDVNIVTAAAAVGGVSVALAFALQTILANVFAGFTLTLDTPFSKGDLIRAGSDRLYEVRKRGIRVTTVRDIETHEVIYLPNQSLITQPIVDVTKPTDDLRAVIRVSVPYGCDLREVRKILSEIANGHPHIIGSWPEKQGAIATKVYRLFLRREFADCKEHFIELARLEAEADLNRLVRDLRARLDNWAQFIDKYESEGFDEAERVWLQAIASELDQRINDIRKAATQWMILFRNCVAKGKKIVFQNKTERKRWTPEEASIATILEQPLREARIWGLVAKNKTSDSSKDTSATTLDELHAKITASESQPKESDAGTGLYALWSDFRHEDRLETDRQKWRMATSDQVSSESRETSNVVQRLDWLGRAINVLVATEPPKLLLGGLNDDAAELHYRVVPALLDHPATSPGGNEASPEKGLQTKSEACPFSFTDLDKIDTTKYRWRKVTDVKPKPKKNTAEKRPLPTAWEKSSIGSCLEAIARVHLLFAAAADLSEFAGVVPETRELKDKYLDAEGSGYTISLAYESLGNLYSVLLRNAARWIAEEEKPPSPDLVDAQLQEVLRFKGDPESWVGPLGVSIALCKTRTEDLYISSQASNHFIDHPLLEALAGQIDDDDERTELAEVFRLWGDKVESLLLLQRRIVSKLKEAKSTTIDTDLRQLSEWLKSDFKEPFPSWKYPLAPVEAFEDSGITVSMKFYVDNVRMDRYMRSFNAFTQIRLRIYERFTNAGILIPYPHRELNVLRPIKVQIEPHVTSQDDAQAKPAQTPAPQ